MASSDLTNVPEQGTTILFGSWHYVADGLGGFTSHLAEPENMEANATIQVGNVDDRVRNPDEGKISDLIGNYLENLNATCQTRDSGTAHRHGIF